MSRKLILDMDGTIADLYNYPDWAGILRGHVENPWVECGDVNPSEVYDMFLNLKPMISADELKKFCKQFDDTIVWTMTPWEATEEVMKMTVKAKLEWLGVHFPFLLDNVVITKHQDNKNSCLSENIIYKSLQIEQYYGYDCWGPTRYDTLVDDNTTFCESFIEHVHGRAMAPFWVDRLMS